MKPTTRTEHDSMGSMQVPQDALYGAQTARAIQNFQISGQPLPRAFIRSLALLKAACASGNVGLGLLAPKVGQAIVRAAQTVATGDLDSQFPIDVFQTGSATSSNMNMNEVLAHLAGQALGQSVHPNDDVNLSQSSNDVVPSAIHISACLACKEDLLPALLQLKRSIDRRARGLQKVAKTGRTHLMDAMPLTLGQELGAWSAQIGACMDRIRDSLQRIRQLPIGGTAVGTGINAHPKFAAAVVQQLSGLTSFKFAVADNRFAHMAAQDAAVELSGQLRVLACALMKISNDLRWMNSGPLAGLGEIELPALQPGSSIMPGKINPVIPEAVAMVCAQVMGNDVTIGIAGQSGNFQLNVMLPLIAANLLESLGLLSNASRALAEQAIDGFKVNRQRIDENLARNPVLVTALNSLIGYERGAEIVKTSYRQQRPVLDVARELSGLDEATLRAVLDPLHLTQGGIAAAPAANKKRVRGH